MTGKVESVAWQQSNTKEKAAFPLFKILQKQRASYSQLKIFGEGELPKTHTQLNKTLQS